MLIEYIYEFFSILDAFGETLLMNVTYTIYFY